MRQSAPPSSPRRPRRRLLVLAGCLVAWLATSAAAQASTISITSAADPAESIATQLGVTGTVTVAPSATVSLKFKPAGGSPCGANPAADTGGVDLVLQGGVVTGPYTFSVNHTFDQAGSYLMCAWITDQGAMAPTATAEQTLVVRIPHLSLTIAAPPVVVLGQTFQVSTTTQAEAQRTVYVSAIADTGRGCPANIGALRSLAGYQDIVAAQALGGPTTTTTNVTMSTAGVKLLCGYFQNSAVVQATAVASLTVQAPCIVPAFTPGAALAAVKASLTTSGCTVATRLVPSNKYKRGTVVSLNPKAGTSLAPQAKVTVNVSDGAPCRVPRVAGRTLGAARRAIAAAHCSAGKVRRQASRRRRGTVVRLSPAAGRRLPPRAKVTIYVSR